MTSHTYDKATTALLVIDPYHDFLSEGGKNLVACQGSSDRGRTSRQPEGH
jgi:hypothetical protein